MTKSELIALLAADPAVIGNHLTARDVDDAVNSILNAMTAALAQGNPWLWKLFAQLPSASRGP